MRALELADMGRAVRARHVATAMSDAYALSPERSANDAAAALAERQYDYEPVISDGAVVGVFHGGDPSRAGTVSEHMRPVTPALLVAADTPLSVLVRLLCDRDLLLVLHEHQITGLVTRSDLGSAPARTHYYLRLASAEIHLAKYVRGRYPEQQLAVAKLSDSSRARHLRTVEELRSADTYLDDVAALSFADLVLIAGRDPAFREHAKSSAGRGWRWVSDGIATFRNDIMHPARDIASLPGFDVAKLADAEVRITALSQAARAMLTAVAQQPDDPRSA